MFWCCCQGGCSIAADDFNRADDTDLGASWTEAAGDFEIVGNELSTADANAVAITTAHASDLYGKLQARIDSSASGGQAMLIGAWQDSSNYIFARLTFGATSGTLALFKRVAGTNTQLGSNIPVATGGVGEGPTMSLCWTPYSARAEIVSTSSYASGSCAPTGTYGGVGTATNGGTITFDDFTFKRVSSSCDTCFDCSNCAAKKTPTRWQVEFTAASGAIACLAGNTYVVVNGSGPVFSSCRGGVVNACGGANVHVIVNSATTTAVQVDGPGAFDFTFGQYTRAAQECLISGTVSGTGTYTFTALVTPLAA